MGLNQWYRWEDRATAESCLSYLNNHPALPHVGRNSNTDELNPEHLTTKWANEVIECTDGKFGFPRVTENWLEKLEITDVIAIAFMEMFKPTIEVFDLAWLLPSEAELED